MSDVRPDTGMTAQEQRVYDALVEAWGAFNDLPRQHPRDHDEFAAGVHFLQGLLTVRIARRHYPEGWPSIPS